MYLTEREQRDVLQIARRNGIEGNPEDLVADAFQAIMQGQAEDVAYSVTEAAGAVWLTPEIWYRKAREMEPERARAILVQAQHDKSYEDPIPEDDAKAIEEAEGMIRFAEMAWKGGMRGPQVEVLLRLARDDFDSGEQAEGGNGNGKTHEAPKVEEPKAEEPQPEAPEESPPDSETPDEDMSKTEPWDGYRTDTVPDIIAGIDWFIDQEEDPSGILSHVWAYETAHKNRARIIKVLEEKAAALVGEEVPDAPPAPEGGEDSAPAPEADTEPEQPAEQSAEDEPAPEPDADAPPPVETEQPPQDELGGTPPAEPEESPQGAPEEPPAPERGEEVPHSEGIEDYPREPSESESSEEDAADRFRDAEPHTENGPELTEAERKAEADIDSRHAELVKVVETELRRQMLTFPEPPSEEIPKVPWDMTKASTTELQRLHSFYSNLAYYKNAQLQREERLALHYKLQADEMHREMLVTVAKYDEKGKEKRAAVIEAEIESTPYIRGLRRRHRLHDAYAVAARQERDGYTRVVEMLSRQWTMRRDEFDMSGQQQRRA